MAQRALETEKQALSVSPLKTCILHNIPQALVYFITSIARGHLELSGIERARDFVS